jgi:hypothetical protein
LRLGLKPNRWLAIGSFSIVSVGLAGTQTARPSAADVEKRVDSILSQMSIEEKIDYLGGINACLSETGPQGLLILRRE